MPYDNELRGVLFKVKEKKHEKGPDYSGNVTVQGVEYRLAGWIKTGKKTGEKYISLALSISEQK